MVMLSVMGSSIPIETRSSDVTVRCDLDPQSSTYMGRNDYRLFERERLRTGLAVRFIRCHSLGIDTRADGQCSAEVGHLAQRDSDDWRLALQVTNVA
jgi:hypothetical protein